jgi:hypothetical protein
LPIGNDLVDLQAREAAGKARDTRFVARVFTAGEKELIGRSCNPDNTLWMLWAGKEAAYKVAKKLRPDAIFAHSAYEVVPDSPGSAIGSDTTARRCRGHVLLHRIAGLEDVRLPIEWELTASFVYCVAVEAGGDLRSVKTAIASCHELRRAPCPYEPTERERASMRSAGSFAVRRLARALAEDAGLGEVEIVRERNGSRFGPPRLYPIGGAIPLSGVDITLSHDGELAAAALGREAA